MLTAYIPAITSVLDASAVVYLRNDTSYKENRKYMLISITIRACNVLSATCQAKPTTFSFSLLELSLLRPRHCFGFCMNQSDYRKSHTQFWLSPELHAGEHSGLGLASSAILGPTVTDRQPNCFNRRTHSQSFKIAKPTQTNN